MNLSLLPALDEKDILNVIIETPKGSQNKFTYDSRWETFRLKKTLPMGTAFPFDFGFIPSTKGQDGDPLDILIIMEEPTFPGCLITVKALGVLNADQKEKGESVIRNDRFVGVPVTSVLYASLMDISDLNKSMVTEIENFFIDYNKHEGKKFNPLKWKTADQALKQIRAAITEK